MSDQVPPKEKGQSPQEMFIGFFQKLMGRDFVTALVVVGVIVLITLRAREADAQNTKAAVDAGIAQVREDQKRTDDRLDAHLKDDAESKRDIMRQLAELSADNRALYRTLQTGERQYRLERPLPPPDGGP